MQMGEAGHICRKLAFGESETQMLSMDDLFKGRHFDWEIITLCVRRCPSDEAPAVQLTGLRRHGCHVVWTVLTGFGQPDSRP